MKSSTRECYFSTIEVGLSSSAEEQFLLALAHESYWSANAEDYLMDLFGIAQELHPAFRWCGDCGETCIPAVTARKSKNVPNPQMRSCYSIAPVESCPECGSPTITTEEYYARAALDEDWGCKTHVRHMRALLAAARAYPRRRNDEPFGTGPCPNVEIVVVKGGKARGRKAPSGSPAA